MNLMLNKSIKTILYIISIFFLQEMIFRYCYPVPEIKNFDRVNFMRLNYDGSGSKHSRNQTWEWRSAPDTTAIFKHYMNQYGFRDKEWFIEKKSDQKRALFIGDSFVEGVMAEQDETIPLAFEKASNGTFETLNGGMLGCGLTIYLQLAADMIPVYKPDVAYLCIYANDFGKDIPRVPEYYLEPEYFNKYTPRLIEIFKQMNTYGPLNFRWKNDSSPYLPTIPHKRNPWSNNEPYLKDHVSSKLAEDMKQSLFNPFLVNSLAKEAQYLKAKPPIGETVGFFKYVCEQNGTKPIIIYIPSRNQVTDYYLPFEKEYCLNLCSGIESLTTPDYQIHQQFLKKECELQQVQFIDLTAKVKDKETKGVHLYWDYDQHMRAKGYQLLGQTIWNQTKLN